LCGVKSSVVAKDHSSACSGRFWSTIDLGDLFITLLWQVGQLPLEETGRRPPNFFSVIFWAQNNLMFSE